MSEERSDLIQQLQLCVGRQAVRGRKVDIVLRCVDVAGAEERDSTVCATEVVPDALPVDPQSNGVPGLPVHSGQDAVDVVAGAKPAHAGAVVDWIEEIQSDGGIQLLWHVERRTKLHAAEIDRVDPIAETRPIRGIVEQLVHVLGGGQIFIKLIQPAIDPGKLRAQAGELGIELSDKLANIRDFLRGRRELTAKPSRRSAIKAL